MWDRIKRLAVAHVDYIYCFSPISVTCHSVIGGNWIGPHSFLFTIPCWLLPSSSGCTERWKIDCQMLFWCLPRYWRWLMIRYRWNSLYPVPVSLRTCANQISHKLNFTSFFFFREILDFRWSLNGLYLLALELWCCPLSILRHSGT